MNKINKLTLPATILIASLIIGGFYYASEVNKQRSIEKQQEIKAEQDKKEYIAKRKNECYSIYEKERAKWNNVKDFTYSIIRDVCVIKYASDKPAKSEEECDKMIKVDGDFLNSSETIRDALLERQSDCYENWFSKTF